MGLPLWTRRSPRSLPHRHPDFQQSLTGETVQFQSQEAQIWERRGVVKTETPQPLQRRWGEAGGVGKPGHRPAVNSHPELPSSPSSVCSLGPREAARAPGESEILSQWETTSAHTSYFLHLSCSPCCFSNGNPAPLLLWSNLLSGGGIDPLLSHLLGPLSPPPLPSVFDSLLSLLPIPSSAD